VLPRASARCAASNSSVPRQQDIPGAAHYSCVELTIHVSSSLFKCRGNGTATPPQFTVGPNGGCR
jgi:hypothetical protein